MSPLVNKASHIYTDITAPLVNRSSFLDFLRGPFQRLRDFPKMIENKTVRALRPLMNDLRIIKSAAEIQTLRTVGQASGRAFTQAMRQKFTLERELDAFLRYRFAVNGCDRVAFEPVAAGGDNARSIHYVRNDDVLTDGQLVLADAGGEYGGYASDITRTWPVNGKFTSAQRDLYEALLSVQRICIKDCRADARTTLDLLHQKAERALTQELKQLGFEMTAPDAINTLFPHHLSHHVGLDLHDCMGFSKRTLLQPGHCVTVEPGVYVPHDDDRFPVHFRGMGIRIEDSVCVQETTPLVLSVEAVKEVDDIEALRQ